MVHGKYPAISHEREMGEMFRAGIDNVKENM
jgi:hypothetical protein